MHMTFDEMTRFDPTTQTAAVVGRRNVASGPTRVRRTITGARPYPADPIKLKSKIHKAL
jgi:hypothetical protein